MTTKKITLPMMKAGLTALAESDPGRRASCMYVRDGEPCCIVGHYLAAEGVPLDVFQDNNSRALKDIQGYLRSVAGVVFTPDAIEWANAVQKRQDSGMSWSVAVQL